MNEPSWFDASEIKTRPRNVVLRCADCQTGSMYHLAHPWGLCIVRLPGGAPCPCTVPIRKAGSCAAHAPARSIR